MDEGGFGAQNAQMAKKSPFKYPTNLRWYRKQQKNMTLDDAADVFGMSGQNLGKIERGLVGYQQGLIEAACTLYKCKPIDLIGQPGLSELLDNMTESEFRMWRAFLESVRKERVA
jgi:transcriptional regulator with XRE-family HTH domain